MTDSGAFEPAHAVVVNLHDITRWPELSLDIHDHLHRGISSYTLAGVELQSNTPVQVTVDTSVPMDFATVWFNDQCRDIAALYKLKYG